MKIITTSLFILLYLMSCSTHRVVSSLSITTSLEETSLDREETISLEIEAIDNDGILSVSIDIDALNIHENYRDINGNHWNYQRTLFINEITKSGIPEVRVTLHDARGDKKVKVETIKI